MHKTHIRNEHTYYYFVSQLLEILEQSPPNPANPRLYIAGDSHCLSPAWHTIKYRQKDHTLHPLLVTGMKIWHLRDEGVFFTKYNFYHSLQEAPRGSSIIFLFGEIDCREGFILSIQKGRYKTLEEAASFTIDIYEQRLRELVADFDYTILIHPVPPVMDVTRSIVTTFNKLLKRRILDMAHPKIRFLDFFDGLLGSDGKISSEFDLDGTHMHPKYLRLVQTALDNVF